MNSTTLPRIAERTTPSSHTARPIKSYSEDGAPSAGRLLTQRDVAKQLGISIQTLAKWYRAGKGPIRIQLARNVTRYNSDDVAAYVEQLRMSAPTPN